MFNPRVLRLGTACVLLGAVGAILTPRVTSYISTSAVVNAPMITVRSPFNGRITEAPGMGAVIRAGQPIASVEPAVEQRRKLIDLVAERNARDRAIGALKGQIARLDALLATERGRIGARGALALRRQDARIADAKAAIAQAEASAWEARARFARTRKLAETGIVATAIRETVAREVTVAEETVARERARLSQLAVDREGISSGLLSDGDAGDPEARVQDIALRIADLTTELARFEAERAAVDIRARALATDRFTPVASGTAVVQGLLTRVGEEVHDGETMMRLVDCDRRFLEVAVSERHFESIAPGAPATVRLRGAARPFEARVTAVRGAGAKLAFPDLAAEPPLVPEGQLRVLIALEPVAFDGATGEMAANFCDVGRTAEVRFDRSLAGDLRLFGLEGLAGAGRIAADLASRAARAFAGTAPEMALAEAVAHAAPPSVSPSTGGAAAIRP